MSELTELIEFLMARVDGDEAAAFGTDRAGYTLGAVGDKLATTIGGGRLRAECEAKRAIVRGTIPGRIVRPDGEVLSLMAPDELARADHLHEWILRVLAQPYADHPDFREEWQA